eukprot:2408309-Rhodomonas_salina.1
MCSAPITASNTISIAIVPTVSLCGRQVSLSTVSRNPCSIIYLVKDHSLYSDRALNLKIIPNHWCAHPEPESTGLNNLQCNTDGRKKCVTTEQRLGISDFLVLL